MKDEFDRGIFPVTDRPYRGVDSISLVGPSEDMINGVLDVSGPGTLSLRIRPGLEAFIDFGTGYPIIGVKKWSSKGIVLVVTGGKLFKVTSDTGDFEEITGVTYDTSVPVSFVLMKDLSEVEYCFLCNGGQISYTDGTSSTQYLSDPQAPTAATHIDTIDRYLMSNSIGGDSFYYSDPGDPFNWSAISFASAESSLDALSSLKVIGRNIYLVGTETIEIWVNDGVTPFSRRNDVAIPRGTLSPYSLTVIENSLYLMDSNRDVLRITSGNVEVLSESWSGPFKALSSITDAVGSWHTPGGKGFYVLDFPFSAKTYAYDYKVDYWGEWAGWDEDVSDYKEYPGRFSEFMPEWNFNLVGDSTTGILYKESFNTTSDNGVLINLKKVTGHANMGSDSIEKVNVKTVFRLKSGFEVDEMPYMTIRQNRDNRGFGNERMVPLEQVGNTYMIRSIFRQGKYYTKQLEIKCSAGVGFVLAGAEEVWM